VSDLLEIQEWGIRKIIFDKIKMKKMLLLHEEEKKEIQVK